MKIWSGNRGCWAGLKVVPKGVLVISLVAFPVLGMGCGSMAAVSYFVLGQRVLCFLFLGGVVASPLVLAPNAIIPLIKGVSRKNLEYEAILEQCHLLPIHRDEVDGMSNERWLKEEGEKKFVLMHGVDFDYAQDRTLTSINGVGNFLRLNGGAVVYLSKKDHEQISAGSFPGWFQTLVDVGGQAVEGEVLENESVETLIGKRTTTGSKIFYNVDH